jgi:selenocysteine lyase/cysteine desulfurase
VIDDQRIEELARRANISLRTGCFCNPGAGEVAHGLGPDDMAKWFGRAEPMSFLELREAISRERGRHLSAIRISVGTATTFADVHRFLCFLQGFVDRPAADVEGPDFLPNSRGAGSPGSASPASHGGPS